MIFKDRQDAGLQLSKKLLNYKNAENAIIISLPRGGIILGFEISKSLNLPLDIVVPRKIGFPFNEELALGAISESGTIIINKDFENTNYTEDENVKEIIEKEMVEQKRRLELYRQGREPLNLSDKIVILVDDGIATGATMMAGITSLREKGAKEIIVAVPFLPPESLNFLENEVDKIYYLDLPEYLGAVGEFYANFPQVSDQEVIEMMKRTTVS